MRLLFSCERIEIMTDKIKFHRFAETWPLLEGEAFDAFTANIAANGLRVPIVLYQSEILDGRNRYRACLDAGIEPHFEQASATNDDEALNLVESLNQHRRHLSYEERAFAAARLANARVGSNQFKKEGSSKELPSLSEMQTANQAVGNYEAAKLRDVSVMTVKRAKAVLAYAPELEPDIKAGKISLTAATNKVRPKRQPKTNKDDLTEAQRRRQRFFEARRKDNENRRILTPEQVDPAFKEDSVEFARKYGHVQLETAEERARTRFGDWAMNMADLAKVLSKQHSSEVDDNWLRSPKPGDVAKLEKALMALEPVIKRARELLEKAKASISQAA
jgi:ParB-like chromosome segregation protein Spo0J